LSSAELQQGTCKINGNGGKCTLFPFPYEDIDLSSWHTEGEDAIANTLGVCKLRELCSDGEVKK